MTLRQVNDLNDREMPAIDGYDADSAVHHCYIQGSRRVTDSGHSVPRYTRGGRYR